VQGYSAFINSVSGSEPQISRFSDGAKITMTNAQAKEVENFFGSKIPFNLFYLKNKLAEKEAEEKGDNINVNVNWSKVLIPLALKTALPPLIAYTMAIMYLSKRIA